MRNIIKKILKEMKFEPNTPDWVEKFNNLPTEERIEFIEKKRKYIEKLIPTIVVFFELKYGGLRVSREDRHLLPKLVSRPAKVKGKTRKSRSSRERNLSRRRQRIAKGLERDSRENVDFSEEDN